VDALQTILKGLALSGCVLNNSQGFGQE